MKREIYIFCFLFFIFSFSGISLYAQKNPEPNLICTAHCVVQSSTTVSCNGGNNGAVTVIGYTTGTTCTNPGVNDLFDPDYFWNAPLSVAGRSVSGLSAGVYTVTWTDPDGDCAPKTVTITIKIGRASCRERVCQYV